ncbi:MAG: type I 3-dehydroquinate dehydratase [Gemmataceae bacterium]
MSLAPDRVCVVFGRTRHKMVMAELAAAKERGVKFIEMRLDFFRNAVDFKRLLEHKHCPWIATYRRTVDGGRWTGTEEERQTCIRQAIVSGGFDWVDIETDIADSIRRFGKVKRVVSYHNMQETPADLEERFEQMLRQDADVYKIAVTPQSAHDVVRVIKIQQNSPKPAIVFCMGELGFASRFLSLKYGAPWIYAAFNKERGVAPGIPGAEDFRTTYPVRSINERTEFYGVCGDPVSHSLSPVLHNHMYQRLRVNAIYMPFLVPKGTFADHVREYDAVPISGYSVTIPHKEEAAKVAKEPDETVRLSRAANTLIREGPSEYRAVNTDYTAAIDAINAHLIERSKGETPPKLGQLSALILGAGGVARAIAHALHREGCGLTITARTQDRANRLSVELGGCRVLDWQGRNNVHCDIAINCTPVGMHPNVDEMPVHVSFLRPGMTIFETIYTPETTLLVREARSRGCFVISGVDLFVRQAAAQIKLFTGQIADLDTMRTIARKALSPLTKALEEVAAEGGGTWQT